MNSTIKTGDPAWRTDSTQRKQAYSTFSFPCGAGVRVARNNNLLFRLFAWCAVVFAMVAAVFANAESTNETAATDFSAYEVISQRNIFDPDRYPRQVHHHTHPRGTPTFSLAGTMSYRKGMFAFFDGTSDEYRKALEDGGQIAGYTVTKITFDDVTLSAAGHQIKMNVGAAMQQEGDGWRLAAPGEWSGEMTTENDTNKDAGSDTENSTNTTAAPATSLGGGPESDILKRLMQQRQQELK